MKSGSLVLLSDRIGFASHINNICTKAKQSFFALRVLVAHNLKGNRLHDVVRSTTLAQLLYCSPVWWGFTNAGDRERITGLINKLIRQGYLPTLTPPLKSCVQKLTLHSSLPYFQTLGMSYTHYYHLFIKPDTL